jgi:hypothetical protein
MEAGVKIIVISWVIVIWHKKANFVMNASTSQNVQIVLGSMIARIVWMFIFQATVGGVRIVSVAWDCAVNNTIILMKI